MRIPMRSHQRSSVNKEMNALKKKKTPIWKNPVFYLSILMVVVVAFLFFQIVKLNLLPNTLVGIIGVVLLIFIVLTILFGLVLGRSRKGFRIFGIILSIVLIGTSCFGSYYLMNANGALDRIASDSNYDRHTIQLYAVKHSSLNSEKDLNGQIIGILKNNQRTYVNKVIKQLKADKDIKFTTKTYDSSVELVNDFLGQKIDCMMIDASNLSVMEEMDGRQDIRSEIKSIYKYTYYVKKADTSSTADVTSDVFTVLISGSDSRGSINETSRSDVDMLVTVNPKTHVVLMTSIPRDYYVETACEASMGCGNGEKDKLTHTGLHGIDTTEMTIEKFMDMDINYHVKVGFSTLSNLVDELGGITVNNPQSFSTGNYSFQQGNIELNGEQALAFARERYSFTEGDKERGRNQMRVLTGILNKVMSPSILKNYQGIMSTLADSFQTNMDTDDISALVKEQLSSKASWKIYTTSLDGTTGTAYCYELGDNASVVFPDDNSISEAKTNIQAVEHGEDPPYASQS